VRDLRDLAAVDSWSFHLRHILTHHCLR
jgi:hypothetical protein